MTFLILVALELVSRHILLKQNVSLPLFINRKELNSPFTFDTDKLKIYNIDPLYGWSHNENQLQNTFDNSNAVLSNFENKNRDTLSIFITGGSTSDIILFKYNWPVLLQFELKKQHLNYIMYIGATAAYSTNQELLKLLNENIADKIDIHISYNGVNETITPNLVSDFEYDIYQNLISNSNSSYYFPNITYFINDKILHKKIYSLNKKRDSNPFKNYCRNTRTMNAVSKEYNYKFYNIIQPAAGIEGLLCGGDSIKYKDLIEDYRELYPQYLSIKNDYTYNLTKIFYGITNKPFDDDCHVKDEYQKIIADAVYNLIIKDVQLDKYR